MNNLIQVRSLFRRNEKQGRRLSEAGHLVTSLTEPIAANFKPAQPRPKLPPPLPPFPYEEFVNDQKNPELSQSLKNNTQLSNSILNTIQQRARTNIQHTSGINSHHMAEVNDQHGAEINNQHVAGIKLVTNLHSLVTKHRSGIQNRPRLPDPRN